MKATAKNIKRIILFLLVASVGLSSLYLQHCKAEGHGKEKKEMGCKEKSKPQQEISLGKSFVAVMPFLGVDLIRDLYILLKFDFFEVKEEKFESSFIPYSSKYFKTLFCFVISPNAP